MPPQDRYGNSRIPVMHRMGVSHALKHACEKAFAEFLRFQVILLETLKRLDVIRERTVLHHVRLHQLERRLDGRWRLRIARDRVDVSLQPRVFAIPCARVDSFSTICSDILELKVPFVTT